MFNRHTHKLALAAVTVAVALTGTQTAHAVTTCAEGGRVLIVKMTQHRDYAAFEATPTGYLRVTGSSGPVPCAGVPETTLIDTILIDDLSNDPATAARDDGATTVEINKPATFAPGYTQEPLLPSEIEFLADMKGGQDRLLLGGNNPQHLAVGNGGVNWNNDSDADMLGVPFKEISLRGGNSADHLSGRGGPGVGGRSRRARASRSWALTGATRCSAARAREATTSRVGTAPTRSSGRTATTAFRATPATTCSMAAPALTRCGS